MSRKRKLTRRAQMDTAEDLNLAPVPQLSPETRHGIAVVALFTFGIVGVLAFAGIAGRAGAAIADALRAVAGLAGILIPLLFLVVAALLLRDAEHRPRVGALQLFGFLLLLVSVTGLLHIFGTNGPLDSHPAPWKTSGSGGYLGLVLAQPLVSVFGITATAVILAALTLIGVFLGFHLSFHHLRRAGGTIASAGRAVKLAAVSAKYTNGASEETDAPAFTEREIAEDKDQYEDENQNPPSPSASEGRSEDEDTHADSDELAAPARKKRARRPKVEIPLDLLSNEVGKPTSGDLKGQQAIIQKTFHNFRIDVDMGDVRVGPTVTQFTLRPADGVKLSRITALGNDLALALAAHPIRIEAPIPGRSLVGIEVPNEKVAVVRLREVLESQGFRERQTNLAIALGKDVAGHVWTADVSRMPHLLVAGATGSGKSVMLNAIIVSLLFQNGPDDLRLLLVDPKRVEFPIFNGIPHLLTPVITDVKKTVNALTWAIAEMDRRFEVLAAKRKRDLASYNRSVDTEDRLPYLVIVIDELADLMAVAANEVEAAIIRLAQMARAVGIHLIVATQRPSVDVITGLIKANITSRIAFAVASSTDSRTILDGVGAEKLLGRGDMLYTSAELSKPKRLQGAFVSDQEIHRIVAHLLANGGETEYADAVTERPVVVLKEGDAGGDGDDDPMLDDAKEVLRDAGKASASLLQRRLKVGYARAARILDILEAQGFIGPADGAKPREVYGTSSQLPAASSKHDADTDAEDDGSTEAWEDGEEGTENKNEEENEDTRDDTTDDMPRDRP